MKSKFLLILVFLLTFGTSYFLFKGMFFSKNGSLKGRKEDIVKETEEEVGKYKRGDINRDGRIDELDKRLVEVEMGCKNDSPCWQKVVGETMDGDNPIYVFDLDLNKDGKIDKVDLSLVK